MTNAGKGALGTAGLVGLVLLSTWGDIVDCNRRQELRATYTDQEVDLESVSDYVDEAVELGLLGAPESPWGPTHEGSQRRHWIELGSNSIDAGSEFAPPEDLLGASGSITVLAPSSFEELQAQAEDAGSVVVVVAEYDQEGRAAVALTVAGECHQTGRHCIISVTSPGRLPHATRFATRAAEDGVDGFLERLQQAAKADESTFLYRALPENTPMRLAEFRP